MDGSAFRGAVRPGFGSLVRRGVGRPIGVYPDRYPDRYGRRGVTLWHWSCRLDCWALMTSGWYLPDREQALAEGLEHLAAYHYPALCSEVACTKRHVMWPVETDLGATVGASHLDVWQPVTPLLHEQVTLRA